MDETLTLLPKLFFNQMEKWMEEYQSCGSVMKKLMEQRKSNNGTNVYGKRKRAKYFELC